MKTGGSRSCRVPQAAIWAHACILVLPQQGLQPLLQPFILLLKRQETLHCHALPEGQLCDLHMRRP